MLSNHSCILALYRLCSSVRHHSRRCSRWRCSVWNCKHGREHTKLQWNLQDKVDLMRLLMERDHCCQWLVKWSAALVRLLSRNREARWQMRGLWYSLFHTTGYQNFSASLRRFFVHCGWSNSSRDTDPSAVSSFSCFSWLCLWCSFLLGFSCTKCLKPLVDDSEVKRTAFLHFASLRTGSRFGWV